MPALRSLPLAAVAAAILAVATPAVALAAPPWSEPQLVPGGYLAQWTPVTGPPISAIALTTAPAQLGFTQGGTGFAIVGRDAGGLGYTRFAGSRGAFGVVTASTFRRVIPDKMALFGRSGVYLAGPADAPSDQRDRRNGTRLDTAVTRGNVTNDFSSRQVLAKGVPAEARGERRRARGRRDGARVEPVRRRRRDGQRAGRRPDPGRGLPLAPLHPGAGPVAVPACHGLRQADRRQQPVGARGQRRRGCPARVGRPHRRPRPAHLRERQDRRGAAARHRRVRVPRTGLHAHRRVDGRHAPDARRVARAARRQLGNAGGPGIVAAAVASPGRSFGRQQTLESNLPQGENTLIGGTAVQAAILRDRSVVAWRGWEGRTRVVRTADIVSGRARAATQLSAAGVPSALDGLAVGPRGGTAAVWSSGGASPGHYAAVRAPGASVWGATETVTTAGDTDVAALVAASPVSGDVVVLVSDPVQATTPPAAGPVPLRSVLRRGQ